MKYKSGYWYRWCTEHCPDQNTFLKFDGEENCSLGFWHGVYSIGYPGLCEVSQADWFEVTDPMEIQFLESRARSEEIIQPGDIEAFCQNASRLQEGEWVVCKSATGSDPVYLIKIDYIKAATTKNIELIYGEFYYLLQAGCNHKVQHKGGAFPTSDFLWYATQDDMDKCGACYNLELLDEAIAKYPVGTKYKCPQSEKTHTVTEEPIKFFGNQEDKIDQYGGGFLYYKGQWAKTVEVLTLHDCETTEEKIKCLDVGETYAMDGVGVVKGISAIFKVAVKGLTGCTVSHLIDNHGNRKEWTYQENTSIDNPDWVMGFRQATEEEKHHLEMCITEKMYVPLTKAEETPIAKDVPEMFDMAGTTQIIVYHPDGNRNIRESFCIVPGQVIKFQNRDKRKKYYCDVSSIQNDAIYGRSWVEHDLMSDEVKVHRYDGTEQLMIMVADIHKIVSWDDNMKRRWFDHCIIGPPITPIAFDRKVRGGLGSLDPLESRTAQAAMQEQDFWDARARAYKNMSVGMQFQNPVQHAFLDPPDLSRQESHAIEPPEEKEEPKHLKKDADGIEDISFLRKEKKKKELNMKVISVEQIDLNL